MEGVAPQDGRGQGGTWRKAGSRRRGCGQEINLEKWGQRGGGGGRSKREI